MTAVKKSKTSLIISICAVILSAITNWNFHNFDKRNIKKIKNGKIKQNFFYKIKKEVVGLRPFGCRTTSQF